MSLARLGRDCAKSLGVDMAAARAALAGKDCTGQVEEESGLEGGGCLKGGSSRKSKQGPASTTQSLSERAAACTLQQKQHGTDVTKPPQANNAHRPKESSTQDPKGFLFASSPGGHAAAMHRHHSQIGRRRKPSELRYLRIRKFHGGCNPAAPLSPSLRSLSQTPLCNSRYQCS